MTEDQVKALDKKFEETAIDKAFELEWTRNELAGSKESEKRIALAFKFHRAMRNDDDMAKAEKSLDQMRNSIKYFEQRLKELSD